MMTDKAAYNLRTALLSGVLSALFAALLWYSLLNLPVLPILFGICISLPIYFTLFSADLRSAALGALSATILLCAVLPLSAAPAMAAFFFLPALLAGWLLNLRITVPEAEPKPGNNAAKTWNSAEKPAPLSASAGARAAQSGTETSAQKAASCQAVSGFYPLSAALFQLALAVAFVTIGALFYIFSSPVSARAFDMLTAQIVQFMQENSLYDLPVQTGDIQQTLRRLLPVLFAASLALYGFLFQLAALYLALRLCARKRLLKRPLPYWPAELRMPPLAFALCIILWALSYFISNDGAGNIPTLALCLNVILSVLAACFCASGLAVLHQAARGAWLWLRVLIYICLFSIVLTPVIFFGLVIMGLFATPLSARKRGGSRPSA